MKNIQKYIKKYLFTVCVNLFVFLTIFFFSPMETILGNIIEFEFALKHVWWILLMAAVCLAGGLSFLISFFSLKVVCAANAVIFAVGLCFYIQSMMLNGNMGTLTGDTDVYERSLVFSNLIIWLVLFCIVLGIVWILLRRKREKYVRLALMGISGTFIIMQLTGVISIWVTAPQVEATKDNYFSSEGQLELAEQNNVVYFIIDTCDGHIVQSALEEYPDMFDGFTGFTYYPNATSTHSRTYPSVPYLLTGEKCYFDKTYIEYVDDAYENSSFIEDIKENKTDIRLFTSSNYISENARADVDNYTRYDSGSFSAVNVKGLIKQAFKISAYKGMPYALKQKFAYTAAEVNAIVIERPMDYAVYEDDLYFYDMLLTDQISVNKKYTGAFRFYHMYGTHPGYDINENVEPMPDTYEDALRGDIRIIEEYINQLKSLGIYDDTTIIITADHGSSGGGRDDLSLPAAACPIMLVKPAGVDSEIPLKTSLAPVCHEDLFATVIEGIGGDTSDYGRTIYEIEENEDRERYYYYTALLSDEDGEIAMVEYAINGDARELDNWEETGNYWDILYSERMVSNKRYADFYDGE